MGLLEGHRAIITGGARGIGAATARRFVAEGATVALLDVDVEAGAAMADELAATFHAVDVTDSAALTAAVAEAVAAMGGLSDLFNNAGVGNVMALDAYDDDEWHRLVDTNATAVFAGIRAAVPHLRAGGGGSIVTNASQNGCGPPGERRPTRRPRRLPSRSPNRAPSSTAPTASGSTRCCRGSFGPT
ncbi:MAG: SDR family NAD(P)-dependent oxidoreductase [Acidimicrobiia bacterium]|nr:SDR family NAD(P)-dependent oxidoreductase [Acidimicrobiia bacterium]